MIGLKVALVEKNIVTDWLVHDGIDVDAYAVKSPLEALDSVSVGLSEAYIGNLATSSYLIGEQGLTNLKIAAPSGYGNYNLFMAVRDDKGYWKQIEGYLEERADVLFSHSLCPTCLKDTYGDKPWFKKNEDEK